MRNVLLASLTLRSPNGRAQDDGDDASEAFDTLYPLLRLREADDRVLVAGPDKRAYHLVLHDRRRDGDITFDPHHATFRRARQARLPRLDARVCTGARRVRPRDGVLIAPARRA